MPQYWPLKILLRRPPMTSLLPIHYWPFYFHLLWCFCNIQHCWAITPSFSPGFFWRWGYHTSLVFCLHPWHSPPSSLLTLLMVLKLLPVPKCLRPVPRPLIYPHPLRLSRMSSTQQFLRKPPFPNTHSHPQQCTWNLHLVFKYNKCTATLLISLLCKKAPPLSFPHIITASTSA